MKPRRLSAAGLQAFEEWLDAGAADGWREVPADLVRPSSWNEQPWNGPPDVDPRPLASRFDAATRVMDLLDGIADESAPGDVGLWCWLTAFWFDSLAPVVDGRRRVGARPRYVPDLTDFRTYYRHLLAGPWFILSNNRDRIGLTRVLLCNPVDRPGDVVEQLASRQEFVSNPAVLEVASNLYFDPRKGQYKRGAGGKGKGSPRRLADVLWQFDRTYDLYSLSGEELGAMLPAEFGLRAS